MAALWERSALELAAAIREGETTSREVVQAHLARIDEVNGWLNAVVTRMDDRALADADAADAALADGADVGPLHGVPCTVKENVDVAGMATTHAMAALADAIAPVDAPVVQRMRAAGAIPIGRTNLPDYGLRVATESSLYGITRNPWHPDRTAGGSSGGEAAALASGMSPIGLGNDIGGSLRNPAHCCGIASIKPSVGVVPSATSLPPEDPGLASQQMAVEGPMARRVADVRLGLTVLAGADPRDPGSLPVSLTELGEGERLRVAVLADPPGGPTHPEIAAAVRSAGDVLADAGHEVVDAEPPGYEEVIERWALLLVQDIAVTRPLLDTVMGEDGLRMLDRLLDVVPTVDLAGVADTQMARRRLMREWSAFFGDHAVILSPTWASPPFEHGADLTGADTLIAETLRPVTPANFLGLPAAVVPHGRADGLPVGIQVIGDRYTDLRCLDIAAGIEAGTEPRTPIDPVTG